MNHHTSLPQSEPVSTAQPAKKPAAWSPDKAEALRQAAQDRGPGACYCGHKKDPRAAR